MSSVPGTVVVLKIGGSVLTDKNTASTPRPEQIERIAAEVKAGLASQRGQQPGLVLVHGAGSFGHPQAREYGLKAGLNGRSIKGVVPTHNAVRALNDMVVGALYDHGVYAAPVHPLSTCLLKDGRIEHMGVDVIRQMLADGIVPVLHGDVAVDAAKGIDVLSGDQLLVYLARELGAGRVGLGTNVDGVLVKDDGVYAGICRADARVHANNVNAKDFKIIRAITPSNLGEVKASLAGSGGVDVTGGMYGKVMWLMELARAGIPSRVFNAGKPDNVARFLKGENVEGTSIEGD